MFFFRPLVKYSDESSSVEENSEDNDNDENDDDDDNAVLPNSKNGLLFVHQTENQRRLLQRYANELTLLDATYKTTKYSLALFFLVAKTNVNYQVVGSFVLQSETSYAITEAFEVIKGGNKGWNPAYFMVDYSEEKMSAIKRIFPESQIYICDFHREQAWERWLAKTSNGLVSSKNVMLAKLRAIARARTERDYNEKVAILKTSEEWKAAQLDCMIGKWVWAYQKDRLLTIINTNNGVERQNKAFKYEYLDGYKHSTLSVMLTVLIEDFLPDQYLKYVELNTKLQSNYRQYTSDVPSYLHERPHPMIKHCMERLASSEDTMPAHINVVDDVHGKFEVRSQDDSSKFYTLSFGSDSDDSPSCDCYDWERHRLPCKHFFAIFRNYPLWSFEKLPKSYTESQFLTVDRVGFKPIIESSRNEENSQLNPEDPLQPNEALENENQATKNEKDVTPTLVDELKRKPSSHRTEAARCREKLGQIKNLTFVAEGWENANVLNQVKVKLDECYKLLTDASPKENGLVLEAPEKKTTACTSKANGKSHSTNPFKPIPQPLKKNPWSGRSGEKAATLKRCYVSSLMEIEGKKAKIGRTDSNMIQTDVKKEIIHTYSEPVDEESDIELKKGTTDKPVRKEGKTGNQRQGFRLTHGTTESKDMQREKEHKNVKVCNPSLTYYSSAYKKNN
ncbi:uncharacterized protein LOC114535333 [Dendronephthya gigantea]|uniref:uncharacterized protein LOC114535333 n=1 Tax=Dendronephthya gigantea TaxID=151771 RepID=UPI00106A306F|nr:uncharacterized protein LOC114535333 [Dendronephthya gigantea]